MQQDINNAVKHMQLNGLTSHNLTDNLMLSYMACGTLALQWVHTDSGKAKVIGIVK